MVITFTSTLQMRYIPIAGSFYFEIFWLFFILLLLLLLLLCYPSLLDTAGIRGLSRNFRNSSLFTANCYNSPSAGCVSAVNHMCKDSDIFRKTINSSKKILRQSVIFLIILSMLFRVLGFCPSSSFILLFSYSSYIVCFFVLFLQSSILVSL
jgi:hypothetical protein